jgi:hypothetical protein
MLVLSGLKQGFFIVVISEPFQKEYYIVTDLLKALLGNGSISSPRYAQVTIGQNVIGRC